jgi:replicative DNA helicase
MKDWFDRYQQAKAQLDLRAVLAARGHQILNGKVSAPWRQERTPSVHIYGENWHDFGDPDRRGDLIDWLEQGEGLTRERALEEAANILNLPPPYGQGFPALPPVTHKHLAPKMAVKDLENQKSVEWVARFCEESRQALLENKSEEARRVREYLTTRRLERQAWRFGVVDSTVELPESFDDWYAQEIRGRLLVIYELNGTPVYFNARKVSQQVKKRKYLKAPFPTPSNFNHNALELARKRGFLILTEAELDAVSLLESCGNDIPVIGLSGGHWCRSFPQELLEANPRDGILLLFDSDEAGQRLAHHCKQKLEKIGLAARVGQLPQGHKDVNEVLKELGQEALRSHTSEEVDSIRVSSAGDLHYVRSTFLRDLDQRSERPHAHYSSGLEPLDQLLSGGYIEGLHLLGGITGGGKTSFALYLAVHNALAGRSVIYGSYEQSRLELWARICSATTGIAYSALKRGFLEEDGRKIRVSEKLRVSPQWSTLQTVARHLKIIEGGDAFSQQQTSLTFDALVSAARNTAEEQGAPPLVIIDYLQRLPAPQHLRMGDARERVTYMAGQLQVVLAREVGCPILAISSINRKSYSLDEASPEDRLQSFKEAGELEYTCYTAALLHRLPEAKKGAAMTPGRLASFRPMVVDLVKNREGALGRLAVRWHPEKQLWDGAIGYGGDREQL